MAILSVMIENCLLLQAIMFIHGLHTWQVRTLAMETILRRMTNFLGQGAEFQLPVVGVESVKLDAVETTVAHAPTARTLEMISVSSTEAQMKSETSAYDFESSNGASSRLNCRMVPFGPHVFPSQGPSLAIDPYSYRNNSLSPYPYGLKGFYPLPPYGEYGDENVEYGLQQCQLFSGDHMGMTPNYTNAPPPRTWGSTPQLSKSLPFLEAPAPTYGHGQLPYNGTNFDLRSNISPEPKTIPLAGGSSLPPPVSAGIDRVLPFPASNLPSSRPPQVSQYLPPADSILPGTHARGSYIDYNTVQTLKSHNNNAVSDNSSISTSSYLPLGNNNPESLNSSQTTYPNPSFSLPSSQPEVYTPPHSSDGLFHQAESSYGTSDPSPKRGSQSSQGGNDGLPPLSGTLANGHKYIPLSHHPQQQYPAPPQIQPQPRRQSGVLA
ncbi:hypothetical protein EG329_013012 [Mollisiaceae sp. DMI_Dod_QoI]|nr:hypothetical protein EG329_013012 [Helotiales sp. DMI_Dod_QoI]